MNIRSISLFILSLCFTHVTNAQTSSHLPTTEWDKATAILMHTPGEELFNGAIHPRAGLFEYYFDVDAAAKEHKNYMRMLQANGIKVFSVEDILNDVGKDTLQSLAEQSLIYNVNALNAADTTSYGQAYKSSIVQQMSRKDLIRCILMRPEVKLRSVDNNTGVEADYVQHTLMNLYFTRDQSITTPRGHIICKMNSSQRSAETSVINTCYAHLGLSPILEISGDGRLEGGDYIPAGTISLIGCGMRTNMEAIRQIMKADAFGHDTIVVVRDHKLWQMQMHLDTYFNIIDKDLCTMVASRFNAQPGQPEYVTADVYARKPGTKEYHLSSGNISFKDFLLQRGFHIIPIDEADEMHYANNYLTIAPRHIMMVGGQSEQLAIELTKHGVKVEWVPLDNLIKGYGAAHCMTQVLQRISEKR